MRVSRRFGVLISVLVLVAAIAMVVLVRGYLVRVGSTGMISDAECAHVLKTLEFAIREYSTVHNGQLPKSLMMAVTETDSRPSMFSHTRPASSMHLEFLYIDWSKAYNLEEIQKYHYPLVYDDKLDWHKNRGIYILTADGSVFWDADAKWLKMFAANHPDVDIPLPAEH